MLNEFEVEWDVVKSLVHCELDHLLPDIKYEVMSDNWDVEQSYDNVIKIVLSSYEDSVCLLTRRDFNSDTTFHDYIVTSLRTTIYSYYIMRRNRENQDGVLRDFIAEYDHLPLFNFTKGLRLLSEYHAHYDILDPLGVHHNYWILHDDNILQYSSLSVIQLIIEDVIYDAHWDRDTGVFVLISPRLNINFDAWYRELKSSFMDIYNGMKIEIDPLSYGYDDNERHKIKDLFGFDIKEELTLVRKRYLSYIELIDNHNANKFSHSEVVSSASCLLNEECDSTGALIIGSLLADSYNIQQLADTHDYVVLTDTVIFLDLNVNEPVSCSKRVFDSEEDMLKFCADPTEGLGVDNITLYIYNCLINNSGKYQLTYFLSNKKN